MTPPIQKVFGTCVRQFGKDTDLSQEKIADGHALSLSDLFLLSITTRRINRDIQSKKREHRRIQRKRELRLS